MAVKHNIDIANSVDGGEINFFMIEMHIQSD